jgi:hypothetical protein
MAIICYNGKFFITAKSLETNVVVVTRADCIINLISPVGNTNQIMGKHGPLNLSKVGSGAQEE